MGFSGARRGVALLTTESSIAGPSNEYLKIALAAGCRRADFASGANHISGRFHAQHLVTALDDALRTQAGDEAQGFASCRRLVAQVFESDALILDDQSRALHAAVIPAATALRERDLIAVGIVPAVTRAGAGLAGIAYAMWRDRRPYDAAQLRMPRPPLAQAS